MRDVIVRESALHRILRNFSEQVFLQNISELLPLKLSKGTSFEQMKAYSAGLLSIESLLNSMSGMGSLVA